MKLSDISKEDKEVGKLYATVVLANAASVGFGTMFNAPVIPIVARINESNYRTNMRISEQDRKTLASVATGIAYAEYYGLNTKTRKEG